MADNPRPQRRLIDGVLSDLRNGLSTELNIANYMGMVSEGDLDYLIAQLPDVAERVEKIGFREHRLDDGHVPSLSKIIELCPNAKSLQLSSNLLGNDALRSITEALGDREMVSLDIGFNPLQGKEAAELLAQAVDNGLRGLSCEYTQLGTEGTTLVAEAISRSDRLQVINIGNNHQGESASVALVNAIGKSQSLCHIECGDAILRKEQQEALNTLLTDNESENLWSVPNNLQMHSAVTKTNRMRDGAIKEIYKKAPEEMSAAELAVIHRSAGMLSFARDLIGVYKDSKPHSDFVAGLPTLPDSAEGLFTPNAKGYAPIDNPAIWSKPQAVFALLDADGVDIKDVASQRSERGVSFAEAAMMGAQRSALTACLQERGLASLGSDMDVVEYHSKMGRPERAFTAESLESKSLPQFMSAYQSLTEQQRQNFGNFHQLRHQVATAAQDTSRGR